MTHGWKRNRFERTDPGKRIRLSRLKKIVEKRKSFYTFYVYSIRFIISLLKNYKLFFYSFFSPGILSSIPRRPGTIPSGGSAGTTTTTTTTQPRFRDWRRFVWKVSSRQPLDIVLVELSSVPSGVYIYTSSLSSFLSLSLSLNFPPSPRNGSFHIHLSFLPSSCFLPADSDAFIHSICIMYIERGEWAAAISETLVAGSRDWERREF